MPITLTNPLVPKAHQYKGGLHCHTTESDGTGTPTEMAQAYKDAGFDFFSITDHNLFTPDPELAGILCITSEERGTAGGGGEITCTGISTVISINTPWQDVIDAILAQSAIPFMCHPNSALRPWSVANLLTITDYLGVEVWNSIVPAGQQNAEDVWDSLLSNWVNVWGVAVDDAHSVAEVGSICVMVNSDTLTVADILANIRAGNFYSSTGATLSVTISGGVITATTDSSSTIAWIGNNAKALRTTNGVTTDTYTPDGSEKYVRVKITRDSDGDFAWSNPITVDFAIGGGCMISKERIIAPRQVEMERYIRSLFPTLYVDTRRNFQGTGLRISDDATGHLLTVTGVSWTPSCYSFDGNDRISIADHPVFDYLDGSGAQFTAIIWYRGTVYGLATPTIFERRRAGSNTDRQFQFRGDGGNSGLLVVASDVEGVSDSIVSTTKFFDGAWHMGTVTRDGLVSRRLYIDKKIEATTVATQAPASGAHFTIGCKTLDAGTFSDYATGMFGMAVVILRPFSPQEVWKFYDMTEWRHI